MRKQIQLGTYVLLCLILLSCKGKQKLVTKNTQLVDMVYPLLDTENSRWFFFSSASRPFGMVNLSPDTEINGAWGSGYRYKTDTIKGFSHIHAWQMAGLSVMPVVSSNKNDKDIYSNFYSSFSHATEEVHPGYHKVFLDRNKIMAELTSTPRVGFHKYSYEKGEGKSLLFNLNTVLGPCENTEGILKENGEKEVSGSFVMTPTHRRPKAVKVYFKIYFNTPILNIEQDNQTGNYLVNFKEVDKELLMKVGISYTSLKNAEQNIREELPNWDFNEVHQASRKDWNNHLSKIELTGGSEQDKARFYTDLWHALQGRRIISDVNGAYPDYTGEYYREGQLPLIAGKPLFNHYNSDSFWGAQWTINTLWGLVYPEYMKEFSLSLLQYYKDGGIVPRGPSGGNYTYVMTGASSTPFIVSAIQKGIITEDLDYIYKALKKNHLEGGIMGKAGYEHTTSLGGGLSYYVRDGFVPYPIPEGKFGGHQDGASLTLEYAYQDWTLAQLAKKLKKKEDYNYFLNRSSNYKRLYNPETGFIQPKNKDGQWYPNLDPYTYENGFIESNCAQSTWFVPHDVLGLATLMGGKEIAVEKLQNQFVKAQELGFTSGTSHAVELHPEYSRIPINYGNQPSIQTAYIFNLLDRPDLTQYWSRQVIDSVFSSLTPQKGYNGDEDQGLMGSLSVLMKMGLFQMNGGTEENPTYQIGSPIFNSITIHLNKDFYSGDTFTISAEKESRKDIYVDQASFNNEELSNMQLSHKEITNGGELQLHMSSNNPNKLLP